jgi:hypothetical protein
MLASTQIVAAYGAPVRDSLKGSLCVKVPARGIYRPPMTLPCAPTILVTTHRPNDDGNSTKVRR